MFLILFVILILTAKFIFEKAKAATLSSMAAYFYEAVSILFFFILELAIFIMLKIIS